MFLALSKFIEGQCVPTLAHRIIIIIIIINLKFNLFLVGVSSQNFFV